MSGKEAAVVLGSVNEAHDIDVSDEGDQSASGAKQYRQCLVVDEFFAGEVPGWEVCRPGRRLILDVVLEDVIL